MCFCFVRWYQPFENPQHMFWLRKKNVCFLIRHSYLKACLPELVVVGALSFTGGRVTVVDTNLSSESSSEEDDDFVSSKPNSVFFVPCVVDG